jgi:hypothetical protein
MLVATNFRLAADGRACSHLAKELRKSRQLGDADGELKTDHSFYLAGQRFLTLHYEIERLAPRPSGQPASIAS